MKKIPTYILILVMLIGFIFPLFLVQAITAGTPCTSSSGPGFWTLDAPNHYVCLPNPASPGAPKDKAGGLGTCITTTLENGNNKDTYLPIQMTEENCKALVPTLGNGGSVRWVASGTPTNDKIYHFLAPLPCIGNAGGCNGTLQTTYDPTQNNNLSTYLNIMIRVFIGICSVLAVIMVVLGGMEYMTSELPGNKEEGKKRILSAIFGLVLALAAWTILNQINPDLLKADLKTLTKAEVSVTLDRQIASYSGQGKCAPIADPTSLCSPDNLTKAGFSNGVQASSICSGESDDDENLASEVDKCSDGNSFSYGLFQVNVLAHANEIPACTGVFKTNGSGTQGTCLERDKSGKICIKYDCRVIDTNKFNSCVGYITNTTNNITFAKNLQAKSGWGQWGANNSCHF